MDKDKLVELAERCEAATGPDMELNVAIDRALFTEAAQRLNPQWTHSLDYALKLVPEGTELHIEVKKSGIWAFVGAPVRAAKAATPALAFCAAALRSHAPK